MDSFFVKTLKNILKRLAGAIIEIYHPDIVAVTGSVGKTSTKEAVFAVLANKLRQDNLGAKQWRVWRSKENLNTELGLPLAIFNNWEEKKLRLVSREQPAGTKKLQKLFFWIKAILMALKHIFIPLKSVYADVLVLEYGADRPGDIKKLLQIVKPKIGVITAIGEIPVHVEFYKDVEEVAREKGKIVEFLPPSGWAVLNRDDEMVFQMKEKTRARVITFGFSEAADVKIFNFENTSTLSNAAISNEENPMGINFKIEYQGSIVPISLGNVIGRPQAYAIAAAFAVGIIFNMNLVEIAELIEKNYKPIKRRMNIIKGLNGSWIIDDSYNSSPLSAKEALITLKSIGAGRRIAILGDMLELGDFSIAAHRGIGELAAWSADVLISIGEKGKIIFQTAKKKGLATENNFYFTDYLEAKDFVKNFLQGGDLVLVKGSRAIELDKLVEEIKEI